MAKTPTLSALRKKNQRHHNSVANKLDHAVELKKALDKRTQYLEALSKNRFFEKLISNPHVFYINVGGKPTQFTLLKSGIKEVNMHLLNLDGKPHGKLQNYHVVFLLDSVGRVRFFCKSAKPSPHTTQWLEIREMHHVKGLQNYLVAKLRGYSSNKDLNEVRELETMIMVHEKNIDFNSTWGAKELVRALKYL